MARRISTPPRRNCAHKRRAAATAVAWLCTLAAPAAAFAQAAEPPTLLAVLSQPAIIVSGSRNEQSSADVPASTEVLTANALEEGQIRDIRDVAKALPNVSVRRAPARFSLAGTSVGRDQNAGFNIRGLEGNRVLFLVDGVRMPRSYVFGSNAFGRDMVDISLLKRVEIIKGPASALYGSDGLAGLVNFITQEPVDFLRSGQTLGGRASAAYSGDDRGLKLSATVASRVSDALQFSLTGSVDHAQGLKSAGGNDSANTDRTTANPQRDRGRAALAKVVLRPSNAQRHEFVLEHVNKRADYELLSARAKPPLAATSTLLADSFTTQLRERLSWMGRFSGDYGVADQVQTALALSSTHSREWVFEDRNTAADRVRDVTYDERTTQVGVQANKSFEAVGAAHRLTYGLEHVRTQVNNLNTGITPPFGETFPLKRFPDTTETTLGVYLQDEWAQGPVTFTPALRYDRYDIAASQAGFSPPSVTPAASQSGSAVSPKLAALWRLNPDTRVFAQVAKGFKAPNASQVNAFFENLLSFYKSVPNPNLKPESSQNFELGLRGKAGGLRYETAVFRSKYKQFIAENQQVGGTGVAGNPTVFQSVNLGAASISGFEIKGNYQWKLDGFGEASIPFAFGKTSGKDDANGAPINSIDPSKAVLGFKLSRASVDWRVDLIHHAAKTAGSVDGAALLAPPAQQFLTPSATTVDVSGQWRITPQFRLNASVVNLGNKKHWLWGSVRGLSAASPVLDAYTQAPRHANVSLVMDF